MAKDYAKRYKTENKKRRKSGSVFSRSLVVILFFVVALSLGITGYYHYRHSTLNTTQTRVLSAPIETAQAATEKNKPTTTEQTSEEVVDYQFYSLLPEISVPDPEQDTAPPGEQPGYWLQLMVYYNMRDASAFLDRLQLMGLDPVITQRKSTKTDHDLFIVILGPFSTKENAVARQQDLKKLNVSSYIYHVDPPPPTIDAQPEPMLKE